MFFSVASYNIRIALHDTVADYLTALCNWDTVACSLCASHLCLTAFFL